MTTFQQICLLIVFVGGGTVQAQTTTPPYKPGYTYKVETAAPGKTVYISGQRPFNAAGQLVGPGNLGRQTTQVFENLKTALAEFGLTMADVKQVTYHLKGTPGQVDDLITQEFESLTTSFLASANSASSTPVIQSRKAIPKIQTDDVLIEIEAIASK